jgi:hypothetical protein
MNCEVSQALKCHAAWARSSSVNRLKADDAVIGR